MGDVFKVPSLKVLVTRTVIRERMDYKNYLGGKVKEELDSFDRLAGKFRIYNNKLEVERDGKKVSDEEWENVKLRLPSFMISFLDGKEEFTIFERSKPEKRKWTLQDIDGFLKKLYLSSHVVKKKDGCIQRGQQLIRDGALIMSVAQFDPKGKLLFVWRDKFFIDDKGIFRTTRWELPRLEIKIKKEMWTLREEDNSTEAPSEFCTIL